MKLQSLRHTGHISPARSDYTGQDRPRTSPLLQKVLADSRDAGKHGVNGNADQAGGEAGKAGAEADRVRRGPIRASEPRNNGPY